MCYVEYLILARSRHWPPLAALSKVPPKSYTHTLSTDRPSVRPTRPPSDQPALRPSDRPAFRPSVRPSVRPPSVRPTDPPSVRPTRPPSVRPTAFRPTNPPSVRPTDPPSVRPSDRHALRARFLPVQKKFLCFFVWGCSNLIDNLVRRDTKQQCCGIKLGLMQIPYHLLITYHVLLQNMMKP